jgi:hypothetical protein
MTPTYLYKRGDILRAKKKRNGEWCAFCFNTTGRNHSIEVIKIVSGRSFIDHTLSLYPKSVTPVYKVFRYSYYYYTYIDLDGKIKKDKSFQEDIEELYEKVHA